MELRVLHAAARRCTWYGQWHYGFGRGGFNMRPQQASAAWDCCCAVHNLLPTPSRTLLTFVTHLLPLPPAFAGLQWHGAIEYMHTPAAGSPSHPSPCLSGMQWHDAIEFVHGAALADVLADFDGIDATVLDILQRYRVRDSVNFVQWGSFVLRAFGVGGGFDASCAGHPAASPDVPGQAMTKACLRLAQCAVPDPYTLPPAGPGGGSERASGDAGRAAGPHAGPTEPPGPHPPRL